MPAITTKQELIDYFVEKRDRGGQEGESYYATLGDVLTLLNQSDDIAQIKSTVRKWHREKLAEIQRTASVEERIEQRKQLAVYDDCLTQLRGISVN